MNELRGKLAALLEGSQLRVFVGEGTSPGILAISVGGVGSELVITPKLEPEAFEWRCSKPRLEEIIASVVALEGATAGHQFVDIESDYGIVEQVMISKGEYPFIQPITVAKR
jgi:hypothetical protein